WQSRPRPAARSTPRGRAARPRSGGRARTGPARALRRPLACADPSVAPVPPVRQDAVEVTPGLHKHVQGSLALLVRALRDQLPDRADDLADLALEVRALARGAVVGSKARLL